MAARNSIAKMKWFRRHRAAALAAVALLSIVSAALADFGNRGKDAAMKAEVKRKGNKVWLDGVEPHRWAERCNSIVNCLTGAARAMGEDLTYEHLMGASGAAFRVQVIPGGPCPCAPHANLGYRCTDRAAEAAGYNLEWIKINKDDPDSVKKAREAAVKSIDQGCPVLWSSEECGLLIGYVDGGEKMLCRGYWDEKMTEHKDWPWEMGILSKKDKPPNRREVLLGSLETAVEMSDFGRCKPAKMDFLVGFPAYRKWIQFLLDDERWQKENNGKPKPDHGNAWCYENLAGSRAAAAKYLRAIAANFQGETASHLAKAADLYQKMDKEILNKQCVLTAAPYPWKLKEGEYWTKEQRHAEAELLKQAVALEKKAVREIEQALVSEGVKPPVILKKTREAYWQIERETKSFRQSRTDYLMRLVAMRAAGWKDMDYDTLIALSGFGACFAYHPKKYFPLYLPPDSPEDTEARLLRATGFGWESLPKAKSPDEAWELLTKTVDAGNSVQGRFMDDYLFLGYRDAAQQADRRVCHAGGWEETGWWTWDQFARYTKDWGTFGRHVGKSAIRKLQSAISREVAIEVMQGIVRYAEHDGRANESWMAHAKFGLAGMEAYAADIADTTKTRDYFDAGWLGCHCIYRQITGRKCLIAYLKRASKAFPKEARTHILAAVAEYEATWAAWQEWEKHLGQAEGVTLGAWDDPATRKAGAAAIRKAIERERAAVAEIEKALALVGASASQ